MEARTRGVAALSDTRSPDQEEINKLRPPDDTCGLPERRPWCVRFTRTGMDPHRAVELRLRDRGVHALLMGCAAFGVGLAASLTLETQLLRDVSVLSMFLGRLPVACISPGASEDDLRSPVLRRILFYTSACDSAATMIVASIWLRRPTNPCGAIAVLPSFVICIARSCEPILCWINPTFCWPAFRIASCITGALQLVRVATQTHAVRLAQAAGASGLLSLLGDSGRPYLMPAAYQCQSHRMFMPGDVSLYGAMGCGCVCLLSGLFLTPAVRGVLAKASGSFGLPASRVLHLSDGICIAPDQDGLGPNAPSEDFCSKLSWKSSGLFAGKKSSLWSGWSEAWSDPDLTCQEKLCRNLRRLRLPDRRDPTGFAKWKYAVKVTKERLAEAEAQKAKRRALHHGKAYGRLIWLLLRRAQRDPSRMLAIIPRDALRLIVQKAIVDETTRLDKLYSARLRAGAATYRG